MTSLRYLGKFVVLLQYLGHSKQSVDLEGWPLPIIISGSILKVGLKVKMGIG